MGNFSTMGWTAPWRCRPKPSRGCERPTSPRRALGWEARRRDGPDGAELPDPGLKPQRLCGAWGQCSEDRARV